jgi:hypothetical protein
MDSTTSRLRRTFAYPTDDAADEDARGETLDEQEQEELIADLAEQNRLRNKQFQTYLLALPALSTVPFLISMVSGSGRADSMVALLAITSLASTGWMLYTFPLEETGIAVLDSWTAGGNKVRGSGEAAAGVLAGQGQGPRQGRHRHTGGFSFSSIAAQSQQTQQRRHSSPLEMYLPYLNMALCAVLMLTGLFSKSHAPQGWGHVGLGNLPAIVFAVVIAAKVLMGGVDPEKELGSLKYDYKGA